ncbi:MAG: cyclopropane-fatty-acyl-phospholipid synthase family protein [Gammaproteobacteria bacterium]|nr:cyclopropane-fatty-acyl-phospholipid synthase family protein [Gammaproteobacteria bacterium]
MIPAKNTYTRKQAALLPEKQSRLEKMFSLVFQRLHRGRLTVTFPSGNSDTWEGSHDHIHGKPFHAVWHLKSYKALQRILRSQSVGFAESYMEQEWDSPDLTHLLELMACNMDALEAEVNRWSLVKVWNRIQHLLRSNTRAGSKKNIAYHYDLGNDFYAQWLDPSMTYSAGLFDDQHLNLESAQENKYRRLAEQLQISKEHRVLEIGCGWGGFAEFAAREYGCKITCLTLSKEQLDYARNRIKQAGLDELVDIRFQDYRDVEGQFDRIVSIEMFEAVGEENWPTYFQQVFTRLKPEGLAGLQIITIENARFEDYRNNPDFIQKYIFPGGLLPSPEKLHAEISSAGLQLTDEFMFGESYAETLKTWHKEFLRNWDSISNLGYSTKFRRMWEYYLCYCEAGFRHKTIDVGHFIAQKPKQ